MRREFGDLQNLFAWDLDNIYIIGNTYLGRLKQNSSSVNILSLEAVHTLSPVSTTQTYTCTPEHNEYIRVTSLEQLSVRSLVVGKQGQRSMKTAIKMF